MNDLSEEVRKFVEAKPLLDTVVICARANRPALVYFDDPQSWVQQADAVEREKLLALRSAALLHPVAT